MLGLLSISLFCLGFLSFFTKNKHLTLIVIFILTSSYFKLVSGFFYVGSATLQHGDLALLLIFALIPFRARTHEKELNGIKKALIVFFLFIGISIFYDYTIRGTSLMQIFRTTRSLGYLLFFILISSFNFYHYKKLFKFLIITTTIHAVAYISQYVFGYSYTSNLDELKVITSNEFGGARYTNGPTYLIPVIILSIYFIRDKIKLFSLLSVLSMTIILGQSRGVVISGLCILFSYLVINKKMKIFIFLKAFASISIVFILLIYFFPIIGERFNLLQNEISIINGLNYDRLEYFSQKGSFIFRLGLTYERFMYVVEDGMRMLLGVGFVPDMDITKPIFILGTHSPMLPTGFEQYNSIDIFFPNIITRYGLLGSIIYMIIILRIVSFSYLNRKLVFGKILFIYLISLSVISLINETFYNGQYFIFIYVLIALLVSEKNHKLNYLT